MVPALGGQTPEQLWRELKCLVAQNLIDHEFERFALPFAGDRCNRIMALASLEIARHILATDIIRGEISAIAILREQHRKCAPQARPRLTIAHDMLIQVL